MNTIYPTFDDAMNVIIHNLGANYRVAEVQGGFQIVPSSEDEPFLVGEPIPPEVKRKPRSKTATVMDFKAACTEEHLKIKSNQRNY